MNAFIEWINEHEPEKMIIETAIANTTKSKRDRDRLTRMELMLQELVALKKIIVDRRTELC